MINAVTGGMFDIQDILGTSGKSGSGEDRTRYPKILTSCGQIRAATMALYNDKCPAKL